MLREMDIKIYKCTHCQLVPGDIVASLGVRPCIFKTTSSLKPKFCPFGGENWLCAWEVETIDGQ